MYDSFDILPILNWHNFLKTENYAFLVENRSKKYSEKELIKGYETLIDSMGSRKLLNGYYAKCLQSSILFNCETTAQNEQTYNNDFFDYLDVLNSNVDKFEIEGKKFYNVRESYTHYFKIKGRQIAMLNRIFDFHFSNFPQPDYDFDLFADLAVIENYLKRPIDPAKTSVNHYNAIKKDAIKRAENEKSHK